MKKLFSFFLVFAFLGFSSLWAQQAELKVQIGHNNEILDMQFSPTGKFLISGSLDNTVKLWNVSSRRLIHTFEGHSNFVKSLEFSPDGASFLSGSWDKTLKLWDIETHQLLQTFEGAEKGIEDVAFSPNGKIVAGGSLSGKINFWNAENGDFLLKLDAGSPVFSVAFSPDGKQIACACFDNSVQIWDIAAKKMLRKITRHSKPVEHVAYSPNGKVLLSESKDQSIGLWNAENGHLIETYPKNAEKCNDAPFSPDGKFFATERDGFIVLIDLAADSIYHSFEAKESQTGILRFSPNKKFLAAANQNRIDLWNVSTGQLEGSFDGFTSIVAGVSLSPDGKSLIAGNRDNSIKMWNFADGKNMRIFRGHTDFVEYVSFMPRDNQFVSASRDNTLKLWDAATGENIKTFRGHQDVVNALSFRRDGKYFASSSRDESIKFWHVESAKAVRTFRGHRDMVHDVSLSPDGKTVASGSWDKTIKIWDVETQTNKATWRGHDGDVWSVCFSPDGTHLASGSMDKTVKIWNVATGENTKTLEGHTDHVKFVCYSPDGKTIASASWDNTIKLWDAATGAELKTLEGHKNYVRSLSFSPDGKYLVSGGSDTQIKIWDTQSGKELLNLITFSKGRDYVVSTPDGLFDGTQRGISQALHYVKGNEVVPLESFYEKFYTPNLWGMIISGKKPQKPDVDVDENLKLPPVVEIVSPSVPVFDDIEGVKSVLKVKKQQIEVKVKATDMGGGVDEIRLYHNGKLVESTQRGFKPVVEKGQEMTQTFTFSLVPGENQIKATAFNQDRTESVPAELTVLFDAQQPDIALHLFVIGINQYKNNVLNLNYAKNDAQAFAETIEQGGQTIFSKVKLYSLSDAEATRHNILKTFGQISNKAREQDVFVFYYAGHGVMSEDNDQAKGDFYLVPHDVIQLYGNNDGLRQKAVSAADLVELSRVVKARKQLLVLDACQSGGAVEAFSSRGVAEQKAIAQLARSAGVTLIAASGSEQFATEVAEIGHGVFTFALLEGLRGMADGGTRDKKITVNELKTYLDDRVPELTQKYRGQTQYPTGFARGQDFPVVISKE